jgi:hypothetical protein
VTWRVGKRVPINVYDGDRPVCQCHTVADAKLIVTAVNALKDTVDALHEAAFGKPGSRTP